MPQSNNKAMSTLIHDLQRSLMVAAAFLACTPFAYAQVHPSVRASGNWYGPQQDYASNFHYPGANEGRQIPGRHIQGQAYGLQGFSVQPQIFFPQMPSPAPVQVMPNYPAPIPRGMSQPALVLPGESLAPEQIPVEHSFPIWAGETIQDPEQPYFPEGNIIQQAEILDGQIEFQSGETSSGSEWQLDSIDELTEEGGELAAPGDPENTGSADESGSAPQPANQESVDEAPELVAPATEPQNEQMEIAGFFEELEELGNSVEAIQSAVGNGNARLEQLESMHDGLRERMADLQQNVADLTRLIQDELARDEGESEDDDDEAEQAMHREMLGELRKLREQMQRDVRRLADNISSLDRRTRPKAETRDKKANPRDAKAAVEKARARARERQAARKKKQAEEARKKNDAKKRASDRRKRDTDARRGAKKATPARDRNASNKASSRKKAASGKRKASSDSSPDDSPRPKPNSRKKKAKQPESGDQCDDDS